MTVYGTEAPDYGSDTDLTIRPANADDLGYTPVAPAATAPAGGGLSLFDELLGLADEVVSNPVSFKVTSRPGGWVLDFNAVIGEHEIKRYRNSSMGKKKRAEDADMVLGNALPMIDKCTGIYKIENGEKKQVLDNDGDPLLLNSTEFVTAFGRGGTAHAAVAKFLGDAETVNIGGALLKAAGWGEDLEPLDPTDA
jgi:hypothetical protein